MTYNQPLVSFVVPVYNVESYVEQCILSILAQDISDYELILINDGSKDQSARICEKYAKENENISYILQDNQGVSVARNQGLSSAKGKWICFVDGDDWVEPQLVSNIAKLQDDIYDVMFFGYHTDKCSKLEDKVNNALDATVFTEVDFTHLQMGILNQGDSRVKKYCHIEGTPWAKLYRRDFLMQNQLQFTPGVRKGQDGLFNMKAYGLAKSGLYSKQIIYNYRINQESVCRRYNGNISQYSRHLVEEYGKLLKQINKQELNELFEYFVVRQFMYCILLDYCHKNNRQALGERKKRYAAEKEKYNEYISNLKIKNMKMKEKGLLILIRYFPFWIMDKLVKLVD